MTGVPDLWRRPGWWWPALVGCGGLPVEEASPPNIVVVSLLSETAGADAGLGGLAARGWIAEQAFCGARLGPAELGVLLSGQPAAAVVDAAGPQLREEALLWPEVLGLYGYRTAGAVTWGAGPVLGGVDQGLAMSWMDDPTPVATALAWATQGPAAPFALWLHGPARTGSGTGLVDTLVAGLVEHDLDENTIVIGVGSCASWGPPTDGSTRVPLVIGGAALPDGHRGGVGSGLAWTGDVAPTVLALAGAVAPADLPGRDLLGPAAPRDQIFQQGDAGAISARSSTQRLTFAGMPGASPWYGLALRAARIGGPYLSLETLAPSPAPTDGEALRVALAAWWSQTAEPAAAATGMDPELAEVLRERGYW